MDKQIVKRKGGPIKKVVKDSIIKELTKMVQNGNTLGITNQQLADKFASSYEINIRRQTISNYLDKVYASLPPEDINATKVKLETMFNKVFRIVQEMIATANTPQEKKSAVELLLRAMDKFTEFLESFGIKEKVADNINLKADVVSRNINIQVVMNNKELNNG